jgi:hypothetical protein
MTNLGKYSDQTASVIRPDSLRWHYEVHRITDEQPDRLRYLLMLLDRLSIDAARPTPCGRSEVRGVSSLCRPNAAQDSLRSSKMTSLRWYRIALIVSLVLNALLLTAFWLYVHFGGTLSTLQDVLGLFD